MVPKPLRNVARSSRDVTRFFTSYRYNRELKRRFREATTPADFHAIGVDGLGLLQKPKEIIAFIEFMKPEAPKTICEIGTFGGGTTFLLSQAMPSVDTTIGVDINIRNARLLHHLKRKDQRLHLIRGVSYSADTVMRVKRLLGHRDLDLLFIDGDHMYAGVSADFFAYRPLVRDGGIIAFHDIVADHGARFGRETVNWAGNVPKFWSQVKPLLWCREFIEDPDQDGYGIGVLRNRRELSIEMASLG